MGKFFSRRKICLNTEKHTCAYTSVRNKMNLKIQFVEMTFPPADAPCSNSFQKIKTVR